MAPAGKSPLVASTDTDEKGSYAFKDLDPKPYLIYCIKQDGINNRSATKRVTLESGQALKQDLELGLGQ